MKWLCRKCGSTIDRPVCPRIRCPSCGSRPVWTAKEYDGPDFWSGREDSEAGGGGQ